MVYVGQCLWGWPSVILGRALLPPECRLSWGGPRPPPQVLRGPGYSPVLPGPDPASLGASSRSQPAVSLGGGVGLGALWGLGLCRGGEGALLAEWEGKGLRPGALRAGGSAREGRGHCGRGGSAGEGGGSGRAAGLSPGAQGPGRGSGALGRTSGPGWPPPSWWLSLGAPAVHPWCVSSGPCLEQPEAHGRPL